MEKNPSFGPDFGLFWPKFGTQNFFSWVLPLLDVRNCCKLSLHAISRKTNEPNLRKWQKKTTSFGPYFGPNSVPIILFSWILPLLDLRNCCKLPLCLISRKTDEPNFRKQQKTQFQVRFWLVLAQIWSPEIFSWVLSLLDLLH